MRLASQDSFLLKVSNYQDYTYEITNTGVAVIRLTPTLLAFSSKLAFVASGVAAVISTLFDGVVLTKVLFLLLIGAALVSYMAIQLNWKRIRTLYDQHLPLPNEGIIPWGEVSSGQIRETTITLVANGRKIRGTVDKTAIGPLRVILRANAGDRINIDEPSFPPAI
jgi:hypothetical protein